MATGFFETGSVYVSDSIDGGAVASPSFNNNYDDPVVVAYESTGEGGQFIGVRVRNVSSSGCDIFLEEPDDEAHSDNYLRYVVAEKGTFEVDGVKFEAGVHSTNTVRYSGGGGSDTVSFSQSWGSAPVVLHTLNTYNNSEFMASSARNIGTGNFDIAQEALETNHESGATTEDIGYIAIEVVSGGGSIDGQTFESNAEYDGSTDGADDSEHNISFNASFGSRPDIVVSGQSLDGGDGYHPRNSTTYDSTQEGVYAYEDQVEDSEQGHTDEKFGWFAIDPDSTSSLSNASSLSAQDGSQIDLDWTGTDNALSYDIYRSDTSGSSLSDYNKIDNTTGTTYTDTDPISGDNYYRVVSRNDTITDGLSNEAHAVSVITGTASASASASGSVQNAQSDTTTGTASASASGSGAVSNAIAEPVAGTATAQATATGTSVGIGEVAGTASASATASGDAEPPVAVTTVLPDEDQPVLGNGVEDEVAVDREAAVSDNGDVRIQIRETGASAWDSSAEGFSEFIGAFDTLTMEFVGREDGEEYEVRARTETEHATGAWTEPVDITTIFPAVTSLSASSSAADAVSLSWTDNADNEDGQLVLREEEIGGEWSSIVEVADAGPNTETFTDDTAHPSNTYRYRIRAYTEHAEGDSNTDTASTSGDPRPTGEVPPDGWFARVDTGTRTVEPTIIGDAEWVPKLNSLPEVKIPVNNAQRYEREMYDGATIEVYKDGRRLPIDEISEVDVEPGGTGTLMARGGKQLKRLVNPEYENKAVSEAASELISRHTTYDDNVDTADSSVSSDVKQEVVETESEWDNALANTPTDADLYEVNADGELVPRQTTYPVHVTDGNESQGTQKYEASDSYNYIDQDIWVFTDYTSTNGVYPGAFATVELDHEIPASDLELRARMEFRTEDPNDAGSALHHGYTQYIDGVELDPRPEDSMAYDDTPDWDRFSNATDLPDTVGPGTVEIEVRFEGPASSASDPEVGIDALALVDTRHSPNLGGVNSDRHGEVGTLYPDGIGVQTADVETVEQVVGGRLDGTLNDVSGPQEVALSNDGGSTFPVTASNSENVEGSFSDSTNTLRTRFTLGAFDGGDYPNFAGGTTPQAADAYTLYADLDDTPHLINQSFNGDLRDVLTDIAEQGGYVWEVRRDGGTYSVEFTQPGIRDGGDPQGAEINFSLERDGSEIIEAAEITGGRAPRNGETFTADTSETPVDLSQSRIIDGSEQVYDPSDGTVFSYGDDYRTNNEAGEIVALSDGALTDGADYKIDYDYKPFGSFEAGTYDGNTETKVVETLPSLTSEIACRSAALRLVSDNSDPLLSATLELGDVGPELSLVEMLHPQTDQFRDRTFEVDEVDSSPNSAVLWLSSGSTVEESLRDLRLRLASTEQRA